jgi:hypothetical protein
VHYRNPGPTQLTNLRLNSLFADLLSKGARIEVEIATEDVWIAWTGDQMRADLSKKQARRLFENFALCAERADHVQNLNR